jgi:small-conductance mechanosensitive channel
MIQKIIENTENTDFNRAHFIEFGKSELIFEIVYYITTNDYTIYRDTHQKIQIDMMKQFKKEHIEFAYPTQSIYIEKN